MVQDTNLTVLKELLDRLDPRLDSPCAVPRCSHAHGEPVSDPVAGLRAA